MASGGQLAMGRVVGSLCVVTARDEDASSAMLASWISQASFDPPGLTISVKKDRAIDDLLIKGNKFNVSMVPESEHGWLAQHGCLEGFPGPKGAGRGQGARGPLLWRTPPPSPRPPAHTLCAHAGARPALPPAPPPPLQPRRG
jgi:flavin reductase (DIM6/NTAB) family NADH-FMN oxidoreductase RutF